ncbi:MAG: DUF4157 domain-containing protein [Leptolyngbya sp. SIO1D8]|nr:DUF4157 domain-containing protein [Leptolyngbya sp. SIO1D8]
MSSVTSGQLITGINGLVVQRKMTLGKAGDAYEDEADYIAKQVVSQINTPGFNKDNLEPKYTNQSSHIPPLLSIQPRAVRPKLQMKGNGSNTPLSPAMESAITKARGGGKSLPISLQRKMGAAMGTDFSEVRVHTSSGDDALSHSLNAKAFTTGKHIFFRQGAYSPNSSGGQRLIAHELTHVRQQGGAPDVIQRTEEDAVAKANRLVGRRDYNTWKEVQRDEYRENKYNKFSKNQWAAIKKAYNKKKIKKKKINRQSLPEGMKEYTSNIPFERPWPTTLKVNWLKKNVTLNDYIDRYEKFDKTKSKRQKAVKFKAGTYVYHGTKRFVAREIAKSGYLKGRDPQLMWNLDIDPVGKTADPTKDKAISFSPRPNYGYEVVLQVRMTGKEQEGQWRINLVRDEIVTHEEIPIERIEISEDKGIEWTPLPQWEKNNQNKDNEKDRQEWFEKKKELDDKKSKQKDELEEALEKRKG